MPVPADEKCTALFTTAFPPSARKGKYMTNPRLTLNPRLMSSYSLLPSNPVSAERSPSVSNSPFALDVLQGLSASPKRLSSKYLYDDAGSVLFQRITDLDEYYPTRCEAEILRRHASDIRALIGDAPFNLIELGAGDGRKTRFLLADFLNRPSGHPLDFEYVPIDISEASMETLSAAMQAEFPSLVLKGVVGDYLQGLHWLEETSARRNVILFLGSNIGNYTRAQAQSFLRSLWNTLRGGDAVLIGFDLKKDIEVLLRAYNDSAGITRDFNLNLLHRINRELGGHFDASDFRHYGTYDAVSGAMESFLISRISQEVHIDALHRAFRFEAWEPIHLEYSYKYLTTDIAQLAADTGFSITANFFDLRGYFTDSLWRVDKADGHFLTDSGATTASHLHSQPNLILR